MAESISIELDHILFQVGQAGLRLAEIGAAEGAAGNISVCVREPLDLSGLFPLDQQVDLPYPVPELGGMLLVVSGSGRRLRDIAGSPFGNLACILVEKGGKTGRMYTSAQRQFSRVTSEFNSHLAVHCDQMRSSGLSLHTVLHGQPLHLTHLSHLPDYQDEKTLNRRLFRWQPETILYMPEGIGVIPFIMPGSAQLVTETRISLREHRIVVWSRHGAMARAGDSILHAADLIEYADTAAHYEVLNLMTNGMGDGLSPEEIREICKNWNIQQKIY